MQWVQFLSATLFVSTTFVTSEFSPSLPLCSLSRVGRNNWRFIEVTLIHKVQSSFWWMSFTQVGFLCIRPWDGVGIDSKEMKKRLLLRSISLRICSDKLFRGNHNIKCYKTDTHIGCVYTDTNQLGGVGEEKEVAWQQKSKRWEMFSFVSFLRVVVSLENSGSATETLDTIHGMMRFLGQNAMRGRRSAAAAVKKQMNCWQRGSHPSILHSSPTCRSARRRNKGRKVRASSQFKRISDFSWAPSAAAL